MSINTTVGNRRQARTEIPAELLQQYRAAVVPGIGRPPVHVQRRSGSWLALKWKDSNRPRRLTDGYLQAHLAGHMLVAVRWPWHVLAEVSHAVIDLDYNEADALDMYCRLAVVQRVLPPLTLVRSSHSHGLHCYLWLDQPADAWELRSRLVTAIEGAGLPVVDGTCEVWPGNDPLRLPLGLGSCLLDAEDYSPIAARYSGGRLLRDVPGSVAALVAAREAGRVSLADLGRVAVLVPGLGGPLNDAAPPPPRVTPQGLPLGQDQAQAPCVPARARARAQAPSSSGGPGPTASAPAQPGQGHPLPQGAASLRGPQPKTAWSQEVASSDHGIPEEHCRNRVLYVRLWDLMIRQALPGDVALAEYSRWFYSHTHVSKDLRKPRGELDHMRDARGVIRRLERNIAQGKQGYTPGLGRAAGSVATLAVLERHRQEHGDRWREAAQGLLTAADRSIIERAADPWVQERLAVLVGVLRAAASSTVTLNRRGVVRAISGNRPHGGQPAAKVLLQSAIALGILTRSGDPIWGRRSTTYKVELPGASAPTEEVP